MIVTFGVVNGVANVVGCILSPYIHKIFRHKARAAAFDLSLIAAASILMFWFPPTESVAMFYSLAFVAGMGQGAYIVMLFSMTPDAIDYSHYQTGISAAGFQYALGSFTCKVGGRILGAQVVGQKGVDKRCDVLAVAVRLGLTMSQLPEFELCYAPPYSSAKDPVNMLGYVTENLLSGKVSQRYWERSLSDAEKGRALLLDVRTQREYDSGNIEGAVHIPLDDLRQRLTELPRDKTLYVHCQSGLRSYLACRILEQNGWPCHNMAGGYNVYQLHANTTAGTAW
jgi:Rhodanese-related sulfurtransferase